MSVRNATRKYMPEPMMDARLLKSTGEPDAVKVARPVRRGPVGKALLDSNSLAGYPTPCPCAIILA